MRKRPKGDKLTEITVTCDSHRTGSTERRRQIVLIMKKARPEQKPRAASDSAGTKQRLDQEQPHFRERSFTDVFAVFSKRQKVTTKDATTNTAPLEETYARPTVPPALPVKLNKYYLNEASNKVEVNYEHVYQEAYPGRSNNTESGLYVSADEPPKQEATWEENEDDTDEDSEEEDAVDGLATTTTTTHKRNTSGWSLGSFHIGTPVELIKEVLSGEEWAQFLEENQNFSPDTILPAFQYSYEPNTDIREKAVDDNSKEGTKSMGFNIDDIIKTVKIVEEKVEEPKVLEEEPESPHLLPPKLTPSSAVGIDKRFRSSVFYRYKPPPPGQEPPPETPKSGTFILDKIRAKLRKSSVEDTQLKEVEK